MTGTKAFSQVLGADQVVLVAEGAWSTVHDLPEQSVLRLEAPGTYTSGNPVFTRPPASSRAPSPRRRSRPTSAWGYVRRRARSSTTTRSAR